MGLLAGFMPYCSTKFPRRNGPSIASALPPLETVKDLKGMAISRERAILTAVYGHGAERILQGPPFTIFGSDSFFAGLKKSQCY